ncbi:MAG: hypothetical protein ACI8SJ_001351, partial [Shewanella sp.]
MVAFLIAESSDGSNEDEKCQHERCATDYRTFTGSLTERFAYD